MRPFHKDGDWDSQYAAGSRSGGLRAELKTYCEVRPGKKRCKKPYGMVWTYEGYRGPIEFTGWYVTAEDREKALRTNGGTLRRLKVLHVELVER